MKKFKIFFVTLMLLISLVPQGINAESNINVGDYVQLGTYNNKTMLWRYVGDDDNGKLMFSDQIICYKSFDSAESNNDNKRRREGGSNLWSESNIRCWLNSDAENVDYICGNPPTVENVWNGVNSYDKEQGFLNGFTKDERKAIKMITLKTPINDLDSKLSDGAYKTITFDTDLKKSELETKYQSTSDSIFLLDCEQLNMVINNFKDDFYCTSEKIKESGHMEGSNMTDQYFLRVPNSDGEWSPDRVFAVTINSKDTVPLNTHTMAYMSMGIRPAFYLSDTINIISGNGTKKNPYIIADNKSPSATSTPTASAVATVTPSASPKMLEIKNDNGKIDITADNRAVTFPDAQPFIDDNNRTQVPVRAVSEMLGCKVEWDDTTQTAIISNGNKTIGITVGSDTINVNGTSVKMDTAALISNDRTYIPVRYIAEALGMTVVWK